MDVEQIELNIVPQFSEHEQQQNTHFVSNELRQSAHQTYYIKRGILRFQTLKRITYAILIYRLLYIVICIIPFYHCPFQCENMLFVSLLITCIGLEILKVFENLYQINKIQFYLEKLQSDNGQQEIQFTMDDFQTIFSLRYAIDQKHKNALIFRIIINILWFLYFIVYVTLFFIYSSSYENDQKTMITTLLVIICLDSIFFIFPYILHLIGIIFQLIYKCLKKYRSKNSKILRSLKKEIYIEGTQLTSENICIICWDQFKKDEQYTRLKCNQNHIFHTPCITVWIKRNMTCPVCRAQLI